MAWDWSDTIKGGIATLVGAIATVSYKKFKPTLSYFRKLFLVTQDVEKLKDEVIILQGERIAFFHTDKNPIIVKNALGELIYVNPSFVDMAGFENAEDALGFGYVSAIHPDQQDELEKLRDRLNKHPSNYFGYVKWKNKQTGVAVLTVVRTKLVHDYKNELIETICRLYIIKE